MEKKEEKKKQFSTQLSEKIWGHRFTGGQRGMEYTLEFLNVMAGTNYNLDSKYYIRKKMQNFRSFVFEGAKEGKQNKDGSLNFVSFSDNRKKELIENLGIDSSDLEDLQMFFKNLSIQMTTPSGKPLNRSWYATMLFPLHESLLFFELRAQKKSDNVSFERNFFARGGEMYYLMLTYGTENNPELRSSLQKKLQIIMRKNKSVTSVVSRICEQLEDDYQLENDSANYAAALIKDESLEGIIPNWSKDTKEYPTLPNNKLSIFNEFAEELSSLLELNIDLYEMFGMLTSLICFQIHRYMLFQASEITGETNHYFIDCLDGQDANVKRLAQDSYRMHETTVKDCFDKFMTTHLENLIPVTKELDLLKKWKEEASHSLSNVDKEKYNVFFSDIEYAAAHSAKQKALIKAIENKNEQQALKLLKRKIIEFSHDELNKKQLPIIRTLARDGGFVAMGTGIRSRYILSDSFLESIVYAVLGKKEKMDFQEFMSKLYTKFNIVIGTEEAKVSGLYEKEGINLKHFQNNEKKLRQKLKQNGLLQEYSDATALICNPYNDGGN